MKGTVFYPVKYKDVTKVACIDIDDWFKFSKYKHGTQLVNKDTNVLRLNYYNYEKRIKGLLHRLIMDCPKGLEVDHINHDNLDNRKNNLRIVTRKQNRYNTRRQVGSVSKFKGVWYYKGRNKPWVASVNKDKKKYSLGYFYTQEEAAIAYNKKALELFGEYACLNKT